MIYQPQLLLEIPNGLHGPQLQKAFATLDRGPNYPYVNAMSGYTHPDHANVLDNQTWTDKAVRLRAMLNLRREVVGLTRRASITGIPDGLPLPLYGRE